MKHVIKTIFFSILFTICISCNNKQANVNTSDQKDISKFDENKAKKEGFQIFKNEKFIIKCDGNLKLDQERVEYFKQNNLGTNATPFHVYINEVDYNINVINMSSLYNGISKGELEKYQNEDLDNYETNLKSTGIVYERGKLKDINCIYYQNNLQDKLSKAVYFENGLNSYLLQVTSKENTDKLFDEFVHSFEIINN
jgi:hypothetical protein